MSFQGMMLDVTGLGGRVAFPFGGRLYEVHLPPERADDVHLEENREGRALLREEATTVLQCLTSRAALEHQLALAAASQAGLPGIDLPPFLSELHGSFADLVQQLQECVHWRRSEEFEKDLGWGDASTDLLLAAASLGHASAVQQLLLFDLRANLQEDYSFCLPVHKAALQPNGAAALRLLLAAAPDQLQTCVHEDDLLGTECPGWTLMHSAASSGNLEALKLLLQLAPELASTTSGWGHLPLHEAAASGCVEAVQLLLHAAPEAAAAADSRGWRTTHYAAAWGNTDCLRYLFDAGAPGPDIPDLTGLLPLHLAAQFAFRSRDREGAAVELLLATNPAAVRVADGYGDLPLHLAAWSGSQPVLCLLLAADPAAALVQDSDGRTPLHQALRSQNFAAARTLLPASHMSADQLLDAFATVPAHAQPGVQPLYADLAARRSMTPEQWQRVPAPCPGLGRALPAVLARSETEAALLAAHLPAAEAERLRISALSLHHLQRSLQLEAAVPAALVGKMLALSLADV